MTNIDFNTTQLKVVKRLFDSYCVLDSRTTLPLFAKDFKVRNFPKVPEFPDENSREEHVEMWGKIQSLFTKVEVCIRRRGASFPPVA
jgi:hypothetical protein